MESSTQSLIRLQSAIQKWQHALNEMMSLHIHVQLVMKVLDMSPLNLKVNILCLLLDKLSTFTGGWLSKCSNDLQKVITKLVLKCIVMLKEAQPEALA